jgi:hypothetical protein
MNENYFDKDCFDIDIDFKIFNDYLVRTKYTTWGEKIFSVDYSDGAEEECIDLSQPLFWGSKGYGEKLIETLEIFGGRNVYKLNGSDFNSIYGITHSNKIICFNPNTKNISPVKYMLIEDFLNLGT